MPSVEQLLLALKRRDCRPAWIGDGWLSNCPAHDDQKNCLVVSESDDGAVSMTCRNGCSTEAICHSLDLQAADLPHRHGVSSTKTSDTSAAAQFRGPNDSGDTSKSSTARQPLQGNENDSGASEDSGGGLEATQPDASSSGQTTPSPDRGNAFQPFPTDALPEPLCSFIVNGAMAIGCDPSYIALPMLAALAAAIGNSRRLELKRGWSAPAIIWAALVGESGTSKTPAFKLVMHPIKERQRKMLELHAEELKEYELELQQFEKALAGWKRDKNTTEPPPVKPEPPIAIRCIVSDTTVEALAVMLYSNPRGVLLARDELAGWIGSFDRYASGKAGADSAHWLSMHNGESILVDRKTGIPPTIAVPDAFVSIAGGIQPGILHRALGREHRESGLAARILLASPPRKPKKWTDADISPEDEAAYAAVVARLFELQPTVNDEGVPAPVIVGMSADAKSAWTDFYNLHGEEQVALSGDLSAAWSKLEEYAARLALVIHFARWAAGDPTLKDPKVVDAASMKGGIELTQWFKQEARRVYAILSESEETQEQRRLIEWIQRNGGSVTAREVQQGNRQYSNAQEAEAALQTLVKNEMGHWKASPPGQRGRPTRKFVLWADDIVHENAPPLEETSNSVDVDSRASPETDSVNDEPEL